MGQTSTSDRTLNGQIRKMAPGESFEAVLSYSDYPASDGWTLVVNVVGNGFAVTCPCTINADGVSFDLSILSAVTKLWGWGPASMQAMVTSADTKNTKVVEMICFTVMPDPTKQTQEMIALAAINAVLAGRAADDQLTPMIDGTALQYRSLGELQRLQSYYRKIVQMQIKMMGGKGGVYQIQHITPENRTIGSPWYGGYPPPVRT